jgi:hypothetical protein
LPKWAAWDEQGVSGWREETSLDLADAERRIKSVIGSLSGEPSDQQVRSIWSAYAEVEKSVAFIKFDLDEENPGRFIKLSNYRVPDERQSLQFALKNLRKGADDFALGDFHQSLKELREARNYLRALLREKRLRRARKGRSG